jgi:hypothetical protein
MGPFEYSTEAITWILWIYRRVLDSTCHANFTSSARMAADEYKGKR